MTPGVSALTLEPAILRRTLVDGNVTRHPESHYLDFVIDGQPLADRIPLGRGLVTPLNRAWPSTVDAAIEESLGPRAAKPSAPGRVMLYVCGECGDLACGSVTARLTVRDDTVIWSDFAWDDGSKPRDPISDPPDPIVFRRTTYTHELRHAKRRVAAFPHSQLDQEGRTFLWPWQWGWRLPKDNP